MSGTICMDQKMTFSGEEKSYSYRRTIITRTSKFATSCRILKQHLKTKTTHWKISVEYTWIWSPQEILIVLFIIITSNSIQISYVNTKNMSYKFHYKYEKSEIQIMFFTHYVVIIHFMYLMSMFLKILDTSFECKSSLFLQLFYMSVIFL